MLPQLNQQNESKKKRTERVMKKIRLKKCDKLKADISTLRRSGRGCLGKFLANYKTLSERERKRVRERETLL